MRNLWSIARRRSCRRRMRNTFKSENERNKNIFMSVTTETRLTRSCTERSNPSWEFALYTARLWGSGSASNELDIDGEWCEKSVVWIENLDAKGIYFSGSAPNCRRQECKLFNSTAGEINFRLGLNFRGVKFQFSGNRVWSCRADSGCGFLFSSAAPQTHLDRSRNTSALTFLTRLRISMVCCLLILV